MQKSKRFLLIIMAFVLVASVFAGLNITSFAAAIFEYEIRNGEVIITDCNTGVYGAVEIPEKIDGYPVTEIGYNVFTYCDNITSVTVPDSVKSIGMQAFYNTNNIREIKIGSGVETIGEAAFVYCMGLKSITVSKNNRYFCSDEYGVLFDKAKTRILKYPSKNAAESYDIPYGVKEIDTMAFYQSLNLKKITIPDSVTKLGSKVFAKCNGIEEIYIPGSIKILEEQPFSGCENLKKAELGKGITETGAVFDECKNLSQVILPDGLKKIYYTFKNCSSLTDVTIPDSVTEIGDLAFCGCESLTEINLPEGLKKLGDQAFYLCNSLTEIRLPESLEEMGESCFPCCEFDEINIPPLLTEISFSAFGGCSFLDNITIPGNIEYIDNCAFQGCELLDRVIISEGVKEIGRSAFRDCPLLKTIVIPESVTFIGDTAIGCFDFSGYPDYKDILSNGEEITIYGVPGSFAEEYANETGINFDDVKNLPEKTESAKVPNYLGYEIVSGEVVIKSCDKSHSGVAEIPANVKGCPVKKIAWLAFSCCENLTGVKIPDGVTTIEKSAFDCCTGIESVIIPDSVTFIGEHAFSTCINLKTVTLPSGIKEIKEYTFAGCKNLKNITIPDGVTSIGDYAFYECSELKSIIIPASVTSIGSRALGYIHLVNDFPVSDFKIYGTPGTAAETYARENGMIFIDVKNYKDEPGTDDSADNNSSANKPTENNPSVNKPTDNGTINVGGNSSIVTDFENNVSQIGKEQTAQNVSEMIKNENFAIVDKNGNALGSKAFVGTGSKIQIFGSDNSVINEYSVYILTDIDSNGKTTAADARLALRASAKLETLEGVYFMAADVTCDGKITASDARKILRISAGLEK